MPNRRLAFAFLALWLVTGLVVLVAAIRTLLDALHAPRAQHALVVLAAVEAVGALLFLVPATMRAGGVLLLVTFGVAIAAHSHAGQFAGPLFAYAAATVFVLAHGPVPPAALRGAAPGRHP